MSSKTRLTHVDPWGHDMLFKDARGTDMPEPISRLLGENTMGTNDGVRLQLSQVEVKPSSGRETPITSFGETLQSGMVTTAGVVSNTVATAGYSIPGGSVVSAAINSAGMVRSTGGSGLGQIAGGGGYAVNGMGLGTASMGGGMYSSGSGLASAGMGMMASSGQMGTAMGGGTATGGGYLDAVAGRAAAGDPSSQMMMATQQLQEMNQQFNLQYLQLQEKEQTESRQYTALSNVMKAKNDTAKNSLSNLK